MDLGASIIAVVGLSAKIASICARYWLDVKDAEKDITRFQREVGGLEKVLEEVNQLRYGLDGTTLSASQRLFDAISDCYSRLNFLGKRLKPGKTRKAMSRLGIRALRWPFECKEVDKIIHELERCKQTVSLALQVDQT